MGEERTARPRLRSTLKTVSWALKLAWSIDSKLLAGTLAAVVLLSVLLRSVLLVELVAVFCVIT